MIRTLRCLTLLRSYHDRHSPLPITVQARFWLANAHYIIYSITISGIVTMHTRVVNTLIELAYAASLL